MKERPIIFSGPMVRAILEGRKSQTRRCLTDRSWRVHGEFDDDGWPVAEDEYGDWYKVRCPYGVPGDRLWVRETWAENYSRMPGAPIHYRADLPADPDEAMTANHAFGLMRWRPSIHMPRWASRITLEITDVRVQRVQEITATDVLAEGVCPADAALMDGFRTLWNSINAKRGFGWDVNPWVWALTFRVLP